MTSVPPPVPTPAPAAPPATVAPPAASAPPSTPATPPATPPAAPPATPPAAPPAGDYKFTAPEGREFDAKIIGAYGTTARELGISQEHAQKLLDRIEPVMRERIAEQLRESVEAKRAEWSAQTQADPEIGGAKLAANIELAQRVLAYGGAELPQFLKSTGLDVNPVVIKWAAKLGAVISPDRLPSSAPSTTPATRSLGETFYPSMGR